MFVFKTESIYCKHVGTILLWRDSNDKPLASRDRSLGRLSFVGMLVNNFMLDRTASSSAMYFSVWFGGSIVTVLDGQEHLHVLV